MLPRLQSVLTLLKRDTSDQLRKPHRLLQKTDFPTVSSLPPIQAPACPGAMSPHLQCVQETRVLVSEPLNLLIRLSLKNVVPLPIPPPLILPH